MRQCPFCSKEVNENDTVCQHCGRAIDGIGKNIQNEPQVQLSKESQGEDHRIRSEKVWGIIFILIGLSALVVSVVHLYRLRLWERDGGHAVGEVVHISCWDSDWGLGSRCDYEIVFDIPDGRTIKFSPFFSGNYNLTDKVSVVYSLDDPQKAEVQGGGEISRFMWALGGVIFLILGIRLLSNGSPILPWFKHDGFQQ